MITVRSMWDDKSLDEASQYEKVSDEIVTVPDQSLSVKDILHRFTSGTLKPEDITVPGMVYDDDPDLDRVERLEDIVDIQNQIDVHLSRAIELEKERNLLEEMEKFSTVSDVDVSVADKET